MCFLLDKIIAHFVPVCRDCAPGECTYLGDERPFVDASNSEKSSSCQLPVGADYSRKELTKEAIVDATSASLVQLEIHWPRRWHLPSESHATPVDTPHTPSPKKLVLEVASLPVPQRKIVASYHPDSQALLRPEREPARATVTTSIP